MKLLLLALSFTISVLIAPTLVASEPSELVSEVISIKYARAADVAAVLLRMTTNAVASGEIQELGQPPIIADERSNSLLISATQQEMQRFKDTIARLDVAAVQVLIEATIIQIAGGGSNALGTGYLGAETPDPANDESGAGSLSRSNLLSLIRLAPIAQTNDAAGQPSGFGYLARPGTDLDRMIAALASDSRVKILQRPRIQTSDGVAASMFVGEARPYPAGTGSESVASASHSPAQQVLIGVTFEVTPAVKPDGTIVLDLHQKLARFEGNVTIQNVGEVPVTSSTEAQAKVVVRDHETILLGGLMETGEPRTPPGVPWPKDIQPPGALSRNSSARTAPNEILVLIRPTILPGPKAARAPAK
ncbi:MAG: hypothetical protein NT154_00730 [Verrucomicrobia bacterium]|nr:hypothetical protein [Verrucomicrobiota bacterium]